MQVRKQLLELDMVLKKKKKEKRKKERKKELDMEQQTGSKQGKEYVKAVYCHPAILTSMQSTS